MQNKDDPASVDSNGRLTQQINIRMSPGMRDALELTAQDRCTSASQVARFAVAKELREHLADQRLASAFDGKTSGLPGE